MYMVCCILKLNLWTEALGIRDFYENFINKFKQYYNVPSSDKIAQELL